ncbi:MAG: hypothetical protein JJT76_10295 [Clostridiaceae bacterium]|nr:hypothetical protein [Clostridiaceae bacterium]
MGLTLLIFIGIVILILLKLLAILKVDKKDTQNKPFDLSLIALGSLVLNWTLYLTEFYVALPHKISEAIFVPVWFAVCILGFVASYREFWNNRILAILIGGLSAISSIIGLLLLAIGRM